MNSSGSCEDGNEGSVAINTGNFLTNSVSTNFYIMALRQDVRTNYVCCKQVDLQPGDGPCCGNNGLTKQEL